MSRVRNFCFTLNNYTDADLEWLAALSKFKYLCFGKEVAPTTGTPHLQGFVAFCDAIPIVQCIKRLPGCHVVVANGSPEENRVYCSKGGDFVELGKMPMSQKRKGDANVERWELALTAYKEARFEDVPVDILARYGHGLEFAITKLYPLRKDDTEEQMQWFYGLSGTGKSRAARSLNGAVFYLKMCNKWWDGYKGEDLVIIEDFDKAHDVLCHHLKIWGDRYSFPAEVKGSKIDIRPRMIIVTSNYHPNEIWTEPAQLEPILRRFKLTHFTGYHSIMNK